MDRHQLAEVCARAWGARAGIALDIFERPDEVERHLKAVDILARDLQGRPRLVLEHTRVECSPNQRIAQIAAVEIFQPVEEKLSGQLPAPGHYTLTVWARAAMGLRRRVRQVRTWTEDWVRETAPTLLVASPQVAPRHFLRAIVPSTELEVTLGRFPRRDGDFGLTFWAPDKEHQGLKETVQRALGAKCPKLEEAKRRADGSTSLLVLEVNDLALGNLQSLDAAVRQQLGSLASMPDHIWLVDTTDSPASLLLCKEGLSVGGQIERRFFPTYLRASH